MVRILGKCEGRAAVGWGIEFAGSPLIFPGRDGASISNQALKARIKLACERAPVPVISAHPLRHTAATLLLNERSANLTRDNTIASRAIAAFASLTWHGESILQFRRSA
jgi:integrase